jgi:hypothetical protein
MTLCKCGCGQEVKPRIKTRRGIKKGACPPFVNGGHAIRFLAAQLKEKQEEEWAKEEAPFCACGCGGRVTRIKDNVPSRGKIKGAWNKYLLNHSKGYGEHLRFDRKTIATGCSDKNGYCLVYDKNHPRIIRAKANKCNRMIPETLLIVEAVIGKYLRTKTPIWHFDNDPLGTKNLVVCENHSYMALLLQRRRAYYACGHADWRKCPRCGEYDNPQSMLKNGRGWIHQRKNGVCLCAPK